MPEPEESDSGSQNCKYLRRIETMTNLSEIQTRFKKIQAYLEILHTWLILNWSQSCENQDVKFGLCPVVSQHQPKQVHVSLPHQVIELNWNLSIRVTPFDSNLMRSNQRGVKLIVRVLLSQQALVPILTNGRCVQDFNEPALLVSGQLRFYRKFWIYFEIQDSHQLFRWIRVRLNLNYTHRCTNLICLVDLDLPTIIY